MKTKVSLFNNDIVDKPEFKGNNNLSSLKETYFSKFSDETLFYIFYYYQSTMYIINIINKY